MVRELSIANSKVLILRLSAHSTKRILFIILHFFMKQLADFMPEIRQGSVRRDHITVKIVVNKDYVYN